MIFRIHTPRIPGIISFLAPMILSTFCNSETAFAQRFATGGNYSSPAGTSPTADLLTNVGIEQHLNEVVPTKALVKDESGNTVEFGKYFRHRPVVLLLVQYRCPMLCTQILNGFLKGSQGIPQEIGRDYDVVTLSFDAREGHVLATEKKRQYVRMYRRDGASSGWHFLTAEQPAIDAITQAVGFRYQYDARSDQFAHASGVMIVTPDGRLSRYLYGIEFSPNDLRLGLVESSAGKIGSPIDRVLLLCYHYDPLTGRYGLVISRVLRLAGLATLVVVASFLFAMYRVEQSRPKLNRHDFLEPASEVSIRSSLTLRDPQ